MIKKGIKKGIFTLICLIFPMAIYAAKIVAFGISTEPFINKTKKVVNVCYLDAYTKVWRQIQNETKAHSNNIKDIKIWNERHHQNWQQMTHDYICLYQVKFLGITKTPAIVFDNKYVVYGETDFVRAQAEYKNYIRQPND